MRVNANHNGKSVFIAHVLLLRGCEVVFENVRDSALFVFPLFQAFAYSWGFKQALVPMCCYADPNVNPSTYPLQVVRLYGSPWWLFSMGGVCIHGSESHLKLMDGDAHLHGSAAYPYRFCNALIQHLIVSLGKPCPANDPFVMPFYVATDPDHCRAYSRYLLPSQKEDRSIWDFLFCWGI